MQRYEVGNYIVKYDNRKITLHCTSSNKTIHFISSYIKIYKTNEFIVIHIYGNEYTYVGKCMYNFIAKDVPLLINKRYMQGRFYTYLLDIDIPVKINNFYLDIFDPYTTKVIMGYKYGIVNKYILTKMFPEVKTDLILDIIETKRFKDMSKKYKNWPVDEIFYDIQDDVYKKLEKEGKFKHIEQNLIIQNI